MQKKRLAIASPNLTPNVPPFLRKLAASPEIDLTVLLLSDYGIVPTKNKLFGNKEIFWGPSLLEGYRSKLIKNWGTGPTQGEFFGLLNPGIFGEIIRGKYDAVLLYGYARASSWLTYVACLISGTPMLFQGESSLKQNARLGGIRKKMKYIVLRLFFKPIKGFLYLGEENKNYYLHYGVPADRLFFTPYAADNEKLFKVREELESERDALRAKLGIRPEDVAIVFCGKMYGVKRPLDLLKAFEMLMKQKLREDRKLHLLFAGDGELRPELETYIKANNVPQVHMLGFFEYNDTPKLYIMGDIFALVSSSETWGMVVNEAMCFSLPLVISNAVGSSTDLVREGENGFTFPPGDVHALSEILKRLYLDDAMRESFGKKSREIIAGYSYEADAAGFAAAVKNVSRGPRTFTRDESARAAIDWLLASHAAASGNGFSRGYARAGGWGKPYPETTGYIIPTLLNASTAWKYRAEEIESACRRSGEWLLSLQKSDGSYSSWDASGESYVFDTGQIIFGLLALYRRARDERYLAAARKAGDWLITAQEADGSWAAHTFDKRPHPFDARVAWALLLLASAASEEKYREAARRSLDWTGSRVRENGWPEGSEEKEGSGALLHYIAYVAQGLLESGLLLDSKNHITHAHRIAGALLALHGSGSIKGYYDDAWQQKEASYCLTGLAQTAIVWKRLATLEDGGKWMRAARGLDEFLLSVQNKDTRQETCGALAGSEPFSGRYIPRAFPNWAAKFYLDSLLEDERKKMSDFYEG
jgi:glycosyltransferase involved in cell wall biosynthesis